jgi:hypothetical protein
METSASKEETRRSYDLLSHFYELLSSSSERRFVREAVDRYLIPTAGERILEVGFGAGHVLVELAERVGDGGKVSAWTFPRAWSGCPAGGYAAGGWNGGGNWLRETQRRCLSRRGFSTLCS